MKGVFRALVAIALVGSFAFVAAPAGVASAHVLCSTTVNALVEQGPLVTSGPFQAGSYLYARVDSVDRVTYCGQVEAVGFFNMTNGQCAGQTVNVASEYRGFDGLWHAYSTSRGSGGCGFLNGAWVNTNGSFPATKGCGWFPNTSPVVSSCTPTHTT